MEVISFRKTCWGDIACGSLVAVEKIERDRVDAVFIEIVERTKGIPVAQTAGLGDLCAELAIAQISTAIWDGVSGDFLPLLSTEI